MTAAEIQVFTSAVPLYWAAGWRGIIPVPAVTKHPPPEGFTGTEGRDTTVEQLVAWTGNGYSDHSVALRMPECIIGIDVDHYDKVGMDKDGVALVVEKRGADDLAEYEARWGALPATWTSTARGDEQGCGPSRILLLRVPVGRYATKLSGAIEIIQRHHRYAVVAPSLHRDVGDGARYRWYRPDGSLAADGEVPGPDDMAELPARWVTELSALASAPSAASSDYASGEVLLAALLCDDRGACVDMSNVAATAVRELAGADTGSRHDVMTARVHHAIQLGAGGHPGSGRVLEELRRVWGELTLGEERGGEFERMLLSSARKAVTVVGLEPVAWDPCLMFDGFEVPGPAPVDNRPDDVVDDDEALLGPLVDPVVHSWRRVIGVEAFEPLANLDQPLADDVLRRCFFMIRRVSDTNTGWIQRGPVAWELHKDLTRRAVAEVGTLMPLGDPDPVPKGGVASAEQLQAARRKRFLTNSSASAIAGSMGAIVQGGFHPAATKLSDLDAEPEILWAGGLPYDLRRSVEGPVLASIDSGTPHLSSAAVAPSCVPTPHWDRFLEAVWPDPEIRAWVLRVLSVSVTGYADAALPILLGPGGVGKTSTISLIMSVLGNYAHAANPKLISGESSHDHIIAELKGRRLSFIDETPSDAKGPQERLKRYTGGGQLTGDFKNQNAITFIPTHTLILTANHEPSLVDEAVRRRARLIPCEGDPRAVETTRRAITDRVWRREAPGVLAMLMREAGSWLADRSSALTEAAPISIQGKAEEIAEEQDPIAGWVTEACEEDPIGTRSSELHRDFISWCRDHNVSKALTANVTVWGKRLNELKYPAQRRRDGNYRLLRLRPLTWGPSGMANLTPDLGAVPPSPEVARHSATVEGLWKVGGESNGQPSTPQNASSTSSFSSSVEGVEGIRDSFTGKEEKNNTPNGVESTKYLNPYGSNPPPSAKDLQNEPDLQKQAKSHPPHPSGPSAQTGGSPVARIQDAPRPAETAPATENTPMSPPVVSGGLTKEAAEVARLADEKKISKAAVRAQLKAEAIDAAVTEIQGPLHELPVAVDRQGNVTPVTDEFAAQLLDGQATLTVDVETSGYPIGHRDYRLKTVQLGNESVALVLDPVAHAELIHTALTGARKLHAHSASADLVPLAVAGLLDYDTGWAKMFDTVIPAKLGDPQSTGSDPGLKKLSAAVLGEAAVAPSADTAREELFKAGKWLTKVKPEHDVSRSGWAQVEVRSEVMLRYAASDVLDTAALALRLPSVPDEILNRERVAEEMTARVAHRGLKIDHERVQALTTEHRALQAQFGAQVREFGIENPGSAAQVAGKLAEMGATLPLTPGGSPSVAEHVLSVLRGSEGPTGVLAKAVLDYRHSSTVLGLFLAPYAQLCELGDGRARPTVYTMGADTGRMTATRPNVQQLPRAGGIRSIYVADPGMVFVSADFSGVELRGAAALSGDPDMIRMIAEEDAGRFDGFHWAVARQAYGPEATKADRYNAKRGAFGSLYGGGAAGLSKQLGVTETEMLVIIDSLKTVMPGYFRWADGLRNWVRAGNTQFQSYSGRVIHLDPTLPHKAPAYCIQGSCRELLIDALLRWRDTPWGNSTLLPIHDELMAMVPAEDGERATAELVRCMESNLFGVAIKAEPSAPSTYWKDAE